MFTTISNISKIGEEGTGNREQARGNIFLFTNYQLPIPNSQFNDIKHCEVIPEKPHL